MADERPTADFEAAIDRQIERALESVGGTPLSLARSTMAEFDDPWYGRLLVRSHGSVARRRDETTRPAGAAIELLRGYCRLRTEHLAHVDDARPHSSGRDPTVALLAGDYLYSAAFSTLDETDTESREACYRVLGNASASIVRTLYDGRERTGPRSTDVRSLIDGTAGSLGRAAAVSGATLAGVEGPHRDDFATLGRSLGAARRIRIVLNSDGGPDPILPPDADERRLRRHAARQSERAADALRSLESVAALDRLRPILDGFESPQSDLDG